MRLEGYRLECYCDCPSHVTPFNATPDVYHCRNKATAYRAARKAGWTFGRKAGQECDHCPACNSAKRTATG